MDITPNLQNKLPHRAPQTAKDHGQMTPVSASDLKTKLEIVAIVGGFVTVLAYIMGGLYAFAHSNELKISFLTFPQRETALYNGGVTLFELISFAFGAYFFSPLMAVPVVERLPRLARGLSRWRSRGSPSQSPPVDKPNHLETRPRELVGLFFLAFWIIYLQTLVPRSYPWFSFIVSCSITVYFFSWLFAIESVHRVSLHPQRTRFLVAFAALAMLQYAILL